MKSEMEFKQAEPGTLIVERMLDAPVETVWQWLVDPELRRSWFAAGTTPQQDQEFSLIFDHDNLSSDPVPYPAEYAPWKGAVSRERVVKMEAPHLLAFTWDGGAEGVVTFELFPVGQRTRLVLTHRGITGPAGLANFGGGWISHLAVLRAKLAGESVRDFWKLHQDSEAQVSNYLQSNHSDGRTIG